MSRGLETPGDGVGPPLVPSGDPHGSHPGTDFHDLGSGGPGGDDDEATGVGGGHRGGRWVSGGPFT